MITPAEIRKKALKYWTNEKFLRAEMTGESLFPLNIPFQKIKSRQLLESFSEIKSWLQTLRAGSKDQLGYGYTVEFTTVNHRKLGEQAMPGRIRIESRRDFLRLIGKQKDYERFKEQVESIVSKQPGLRSWLSEKPAKVMEYDLKWPKLMDVCRFFQINPKQDCYIHELTIPGVDSKFVEQHRGIIRDLLDQVLEKDAINNDAVGLSKHGFERRYGLKYEAPLIRFRLLDKNPAKRPGLFDMSTPIDEFRTISIPCKQVFVTENKINGLSFPQIKNSIVIFGLGYGIQTLKNIEWLKNKDIIYWGDIDTHGFAMLSQLRTYYPQTRSLLMDDATLFKFKELWVEEQTDKRCIAELPNLTDEENRLYRKLKDNVTGKNIRLEQERIAFDYVCSKLGVVF